MSKSCQYCPNEGDFLDSTEKRLHFLSQWHKTNVKRSYYGLCSLKYSEFTLLPVKAFLLQNESLPSFPHLPMQQDDSEADFVNLNSDSWIRFLNSFASTHETVNPLSQFPERVCVHRSLFSTEKCETISQEVIVATADKISTYIDLAFTFIYITAEEYFIRVVNYCVNRGEIKLVFSREKRTYSCRKKQGGSQLLRDKKGKIATSAGSMLRRENELSLIRDATSDIKSLKKEVAMQSYRHFIYISSHLKQYINLDELFEGNPCFCGRKFPSDLRSSDRYDSVNLIADLIVLGNWDNKIASNYDKVFIN